MPILCGPVDDKTHFATVTVSDADGNVLYQYPLNSSSTTPEEAALGTGRARQAVHTENRAVRAAGGPPVIGQTTIVGDPFWRTAPVSEGGNVLIEGTNPPCGPCQRMMNEGATETAATFEYTWPDGQGGLNRWRSTG